MDECNEDLRAGLGFISLTFEDGTSADMQLNRTASTSLGTLSSNEPEPVEFLVRIVSLLCVCVRG